MKAWEILKLLEEGNVLETDDYIMRLQLSKDGTSSSIHHENKHDKNDYWFYNLNNFDGNWQIKREPIPFEKAIEYMNAGRVCESDIYHYKIHDHKLFCAYKNNGEWIKDVTCYNELTAFDWYLLPQEK